MRQQKFPPRMPKIKRARGEESQQARSCADSGFCAFGADVGSTPAARCSETSSKLPQILDRSSRLFVSTRWRRSFGFFTESSVAQRSCCWFEREMGSVSPLACSPCSSTRADKPLHFCSRKAEPADHPCSCINANRSCCVRTKRSAACQSVSGAVAEL